PLKRIGLAIALLLPACTPEDSENGSDNTGGSTNNGGTTTSSSTSGTSVGGAGGSGTTPTGTAGGGGSGGMQGPWDGPIQSLQELDLGDIVLNATVEVPIPEFTLGFTAVVAAPSQDEVIGIARLRNPLGSSVIFNFAIIN